MWTQNLSLCIALLYVFPVIRASLSRAVLPSDGFPDNGDLVGLDVSAKNQQFIYDLREQVRVEDLFAMMCRVCRRRRVVRCINRWCIRGIDVRNV